MRRSSRHLQIEEPALLQCLMVVPTDKEHLSLMQADAKGDVYEGGRYAEFRYLLVSVGGQKKSSL